MMESSHFSFFQKKKIKNYILLEKIGEGGYGLVLKAKQQSTNQLVAIKTIKISPNENEQIKKDNLTVSKEKPKYVQG